MESLVLNEKEKNKTFHFFYPIRNAEKFSKNGLILNLGCGEKAYREYVNIDKKNLPGVDLVWDLEKTPLPFQDNSVSEIKCEHVLEHISNFMPLMEELYRISKPKAKIKIFVPYYRYEGAYRDPTHVRFFTEHSFDYFQEGVKFSHYSKARFKVKYVKKQIRFFSDVKERRKKIMQLIPDFLRPILDIFFWSIYSEINYELEVLK